MLWGTALDNLVWWRMVDLQGLARFSDDVSVETDYLVVELARHLLGEGWLTAYVAKANAGGIERVLV